MNVRNTIAKWILGEYSTQGRENGQSYFPDFNETRQPFAQAIFLNIVELLTDLTNDTILLLKRGDTVRFAELKVFFESDGQLVLNRLFENGFSVIVYGDFGFKLLDADQYTINAQNKTIVTDTKYKRSRVYVLKSDIYRSKGISDKAILNSYIQYLENILNASNTSTARLGYMIMACPVTPSGVNAVTKLIDTDKEKLEKDISENYGALKSQRQIHIWRQQMAFTTVNLSGMDAKTIEKAKFAINVICDRIKVPSNQISVIDASNTNSLSNGGEMREGDLLKYKSYERLLNKTFVKMANDLEMVIDYDIYNKPKAEKQTTIEI